MDLHACGSGLAALGDRAPPTPGGRRSNNMKDRNTTYKECNVDNNTSTDTNTNIICMYVYIYIYMIHMYTHECIYIYIYV